MSSLTEREQLTTVVFGDTFALYDDESFEEFIVPLRERFANNAIDLSVFEGKRCLDAGCGGGRGSILMAEAGASQVVGVDLSETNVATSRMRAEQRGLSQCTFQQASLLEVPFEDESFDVVWSNGVLHHTDDPDLTLREITRVLKPGGWMWLYLYGSGGVYWYMADWVRGVLSDVDVRDTIYQLRLQDVPIRRIAEWMDDWFVPWLRRYTVADVRDRLVELGFERAEALPRGTVYDTSERLVEASEVEAQLMGDGDVRFWSQKTSAPSGSDEHVLPDPPDAKGSPYDDGPEVTRFAEPLAAVEQALERLEAARGFDPPAYRIMVCGLVHAFVRTQLEQAEPFDTDALAAYLGDVREILEGYAELDLSSS